MSLFSCVVSVLVRLVCLLASEIFQQRLRASVTVTRAMRALVCHAWGDPTRSRADGGVLGVEDVPAPSVVPPKGVRVNVICASLNYADVLLVRNRYQEKPALPFIPGGEFCGVIAELGRDVENAKTFAVGQTVAGVVVGGGAMAEQVVVPDAASSIFPVPKNKNVSPAEAAAFPIAYGTAYLALVHRARVGPGTNVLVLGAGGGVGYAAVQIAKAIGCFVVAVARGGEKIKACQEAGADVCLDSDTLHDVKIDQDTPRNVEETFAGLPVAVKKALKGELADVLFDPIGGAGFQKGISSLKWGGTVLVIGFASGKIPKLQMNLALVKNITVHGVYWGAHASKDKETMARCTKEVGSMLANGFLKPKVDRQRSACSLEQAWKSFKALEHRDVVGKTVVVVGSVGDAFGDGRGGRSRL